MVVTFLVNYLLSMAYQAHLLCLNILANAIYLSQIITNQAASKFLIASGPLLLLLDSLLELLSSDSTRIFSFSVTFFFLLLFFCSLLSFLLGFKLQILV